MAKSLSNAKLFSSVFADGFSSTFKSRGFSSAASQGVAKTGSVNNPMMGKKVAEEKAAAAAHKVAWVPDPKTGYYRPENGAQEIDVAELRAILLKQKNN